MDYRSTLIRNVEIPSTLPAMETLTNLEGSIILKDVEPTASGVRIEGDLLWRGFFEEDGTNGGECLWEGAEYFAEVIDTEALRAASPPLIEPQVVSLIGEALSESTFRLAFDIRWYGEEEKEEDPIKTATQKGKPATTDTCPCKQKQEKQTPSREEWGSMPKQREAVSIDNEDFDEKIEAIDKTWREKLKTINEDVPVTVEAVGKSPSLPKREESKTAEENEKNSEPKLKCCPYSAYCLRYYRAQEGDELEKIAEKFSATVSKLKQYNALEDTRIKAGRMLRIP